jgi:hypothetical protein
MPLNEADRSWIRETIQNAHQVHGWNKLTRLIKDWGATGALVAVLLLAVSQWTAYTEFRVHTEDRLSVVEGQLAKQSLTTHASLPSAEFQATLQDLHSAVATVRKQRLNVSTKIINDLQQQLVATDTNSVGFWPTTGEFINLRSDQGKGSLLSALPSCTDYPPTPMKITGVLNPNAATFSRGTYENCRFTLDFEKDDQRLNAFLKNGIPLITFKHCLIVYGGGAVNLILAWNNDKSSLSIGKQPPTNLTLSGNALEFEDCQFLFSIKNTPPLTGQEVTRTLLAQSGGTLRLPNPQR